MKKKEKYEGPRRGVASRVKMVQRFVPSASACEHRENMGVD